MCFVLQLIGIVATLMLAGSVISMFIVMFDQDAKSVTPRKVWAIFVAAVLVIIACGAIYDARGCKDEEPCCQKECKK